MNINVLCGIIKKSLKELQELENLENDVVDIDDNIAASYIKDHLTSMKDQGKGWGTKEAFQTIQKTIKNDFGIETDDAVQGLLKIKELLNSKSENQNVDEKLKRDIEILKEKNISLTDQINKKEQDDLLNNKKGILKKELDKIILENFGESTDRLKSIAVDEFFKTAIWEVEDNDISIYSDKEKTKLLKIENKHATLKDFALPIFNDILPQKSKSKDLPNGGGNEEKYIPKGETLGSLYKELAIAKTLDERNSILAKIEKLQ
jgi:hypothetical protein